MDSWKRLVIAETHKDVVVIEASKMEASNDMSVCSIST